MVNNNTRTIMALGIELIDLDINLSIKSHMNIRTDISIDNLICKLVELVKIHGKYVSILNRDIGDVYQYNLGLKYLNIIIVFTFEFDNLCQFLNIVYYNNDQTKSFLKLALSIADEPTVKYIENDHSGQIPSYRDTTISLKPGEYLIHLSHRILSYLDFNRVRLDDDSCLITKDEAGIEIRTKLWLYYLIKHGKSWYAKFGYEPNTNRTEYITLINDVRSLKLTDICKCLRNIIGPYPSEQLLPKENANVIPVSKSKKKRDRKKRAANRSANTVSPTFIAISQDILSQLESCDETLYEYTMRCSLVEFTNLSNNLSQSIYAKSIIINDITIDFTWYHMVKKLQFANILQINNDIRNHHYIVPKI